MRRLRGLDLFCGAGGASMGYHKAGFEMVGVDINPQPEYPFEFHQADAMSFPLIGFDFIHASPPCQAFTPLSALPGAGVKNPPVDLVQPLRNLLKVWGGVYVIENVVQARLVDPIRLCGKMFGLKLYRHRDFESSVDLVAPRHLPHSELCMRAGYVPTLERPFMSVHGRNGHNSKEWVRTAAEYMGVPWMTTLNSVCEAIPPIYTSWVGQQLVDELRERRDSSRRAS